MAFLEKAFDDAVLHYRINPDLSRQEPFQELGGLPSHDGLGVRVQQHALLGN